MARTYSDPKRVIMTEFSQADSEAFLDEVRVSVDLSLNKFDMDAVALIFRGETGWHE